MLKSSASRFGMVPVTLHWLTAVLILIALVTGFRASGGDDPASAAGLLRIHIPAALTILVLTVIHVLWWLIFDTKPQPPAGSPAWQNILARAVHMLLYLAIFGLIGSGIAMLALSGAGPQLFSGSGGALPDFAQYKPRAPHGVAALGLIALVIAHIGAALFHHYIRRDGMLRRMWFRS